MKNGKRKMQNFKTYIFRFPLCRAFALNKFLENPVKLYGNNLGWC